MDLKRRFVAFVAFVACAVVAGSLAACGSDAKTSSASPSTATSVATTTAAASTSTASNGTQYPLTVQLCGQSWTYDRAPQRIVTTDTPMLDLALMLGVQDRVVGYFGTASHLDPSVQDKGQQLKRLGDNFPYPTLEAVLAGQPDLVLSYGYNPEAGFTPERLKQEKIGNFTVAEGCDNFAGTSTVDSFYDDVRTLAKILNASDRAEELITGWKARVTAVRAAVPAGRTVRVLNTGSGDPAEPFVSAKRAVAHDLIQIAGGTDVFGDTDEAYLSPTWEEVVSRDPQLIVESSGGGQKSLDAVKQYLATNPALSGMAAVVHGNFITMKYEQGVPGPQMFTGLELIVRAIADAK